VRQRRLGEIAARVVLATLLLLVVVALDHRDRRSRVARGGPVGAAAGVQRLYAPLPATGWTTAAFALTNNGSRPVVVGSIVHGKEFRVAGGTVQLQSGETRVVGLEAIVPEGAGQKRAIAGIELDYVRSTPDVAARLMLAGPGGDAEAAVVFRPLGAGEP
jgi:hypothetical protein